ncbi:MAG TPA: hypothetical protein VMY77_11375 [Chitinophagaceae bacterium]|nr:hypothetical protein [Chitinophagaceae bacterium]
MKKFPAIILLLAFTSISFISCQKEFEDEINTTTSTTPGYYIKGKKDGVAFNFTTMAQVTITAIPPVTLVSILGFKTPPEGLNLGINLMTGTLQPGTYREDNTGTDYSVGGVYNPNSTDYVYAAGIQTSVKPLVITILTKTATEVTGTFSGAFYKQSLSGTFFSEFITITEGEFKLPIK